LIAPDSSVVVAAIAPWHPGHSQARASLIETDVRLSAHVAFETTSTLSRMPEGHRISPRLVLDVLRRDFPEPWLALTGNDQRASLEKAVAQGVRGGALYDALIAAVAAKHGAELLSADARARPTYEAMGIGAVFIDFESAP
jgi:predicted nucleic acid-binding protein